MVSPSPARTAWCESVKPHRTRCALVDRKFPAPRAGARLAPSPEPTCCRGVTVPAAPRSYAAHLRDLLDRRLKAVEAAWAIQVPEGEGTDEARQLTKRSSASGVAGEVQAEAPQRA